MPSGGGARDGAGEGGMAVIHAGWWLTGAGGGPGKLDGDGGFALKMVARSVIAAGVVAPCGRCC